MVASSIRGLHSVLILQHRGVSAQVDTAGPAVQHLGCQIQDAGGRIGATYSTRVNVGDQIPIGICVCSVWAVRQIGGQTFGGSEAWTLSDQEHGDSRCK